MSRRRSSSFATSLMVSPPRVATTFPFLFFFIFLCAFFFAISPAVGERVRRERARDDQPYTILARGAFDGVAISVHRSTWNKVIDGVNPAALLDTLVFDVAAYRISYRLKPRHSSRPGSNPAPPLQLLRTLSRLVLESESCT